MFNMCFSLDFVFGLKIDVINALLSVYICDIFLGNYTV